MHQVELKIMATWRMGLHEIDETDVSSIIGLLGYQQRLTRPPEGREPELRQIRIGNRIYKKVDIDKATWL